jgi:hypothetical protein
MGVGCQISEHCGPVAALLGGRYPGHEPLRFQARCPSHDFDAPLQATRLSREICFGVDLGLQPFDQVDFARAAFAPVG